MQLAWAQLSPCLQRSRLMPPQRSLSWQLLTAGKLAEHRLHQWYLASACCFPATQVLGPYSSQTSCCRASYQSWSPTDVHIKAVEIEDIERHGMEVSTSDSSDHRNLHVNDMQQPDLQAVGGSASHQATQYHPRSAHPAQQLSEITAGTATHI